MTESSIEIELARDHDARSIALLARDEIEYGLGWRYRPEAVRGFMHDSETLVLVARANEGDGSNSELAGFAVMTYSKLDAHLLLLAVTPQHRRKGIAQRLVAWLEKTALYAGVQTVHLEVRQENVSALTFYESLGYSKVELVHNYYRGPDGNTENAWKMRRVLVEIETPNVGPDSSPRGSL